MGHFFILSQLSEYVIQTSGLIQWFLALIASHPDVLARAHAELDMVIGQDYWPSAEDEQRLPYIRAVIKEVRAVRKCVNRPCLKFS